MLCLKMRVVRMNRVLVSCNFYFYTKADKMWKRMNRKKAKKGWQQQKELSEKCLKSNEINWLWHVHRTTLIRWKLKMFNRATFCTLYSSYASHAEALKCVNQNWFHYVSFAIFLLIFEFFCVWWNGFDSLASSDCCLLGIDWQTRPIN